MCTVRQRRPGSEQDVPQQAGPPAMTTYPSSDESFARLHKASWNVGDVAVLTPAGKRWLVTGTNGENAVRAEGANQTEACGRGSVAATPPGCRPRSCRS